MTNSIHILAPTSAEPLSTIDHFKQLSPMPAFDPIIREFIKAMASALMNARYKSYPELVALGFWLRTQHRSLKSKRPNNSQRALGTVVHFTPSNVDTMFIYSWVCGLFVGNKNIIRVATQSSESQDNLLTVLNELMGQPAFSAIAARNLFVKYDKYSKWSHAFSLVADARVMWGGDDSVQAIRQLPTKPRTREISFADRYSAAVINLQGDSGNATAEAIAKRLWSDTLPFAQQACSSPRVIYWLGDTNYQAPFFGYVSAHAEQQLEPNITLRNEQLVLSQYAQAVCNAEALQYGSVSVVTTDTVAPLLEMHQGQMTYLVVRIDSLDDIVKTQTDKLQTLAYAGCSVADFDRLLSNPQLSGVDRLVPLGSALDFNTTWDGMDLLSMLSRTISIE